MKWRNSKERELLSSKVPHLIDDNDIITAYPLADSSTLDSTSATSSHTYSASTSTAEAFHKSSDINNEKATDRGVKVTPDDLDLEPISDCSDSESLDHSDTEEQLQID